MLESIIAFLKRIYSESYLDLHHKAQIIRRCGQFVDALDNNEEHLLVFVLSKPFQRCFAVLHVAKENHEIVKIEFLCKSDIAKYISPQVLDPLDLLLLNE